MNKNEMFEVQKEIELENEKAIREARKKVRVYRNEYTTFGGNTEPYPMIIPKLPPKNKNKER